MTFDTELFISEIEKRPGLYNVKIPEYANKIAKGALWAEVCEIFIKDWHDLQEKEKDIRGKELQNKWRNLRTTFRREYNLQKSARSGCGASKKRKYIYFDQLLFLRDSIEGRETSSNLSLQRESEHDSDSGETAEPIVKPPVSSTPSVSSSKVTPRKKPCASSYEESLLNLLREKKREEEEIDEDKYFLLSLLPAFRKFSDEQKFVARSEMMRIMRRIQLSGTLHMENQRATPITHAASTSHTNLTNSVDNFNIEYIDTQNIMSPQAPSATLASWDDDTSDLSSLLTLN